jgi:hypothetical protein
MKHVLRRHFFVRDMVEEFELTLPAVGSSKGCVPVHRTYVLKTGTPSPFPNGLESEGVQ